MFHNLLDSFKSVVQKNIIKQSLGGNNSGNSIIEIVIALAIFILISSSLASVIMGSYNIYNRQSEIIEAGILAKSGIEATRFIKDNKWNNLIYDQSAVSLISDTWEFLGEGTTEQIGDYSRVINFFDIYRDENGAVVPQASSSEGGVYLDVHSKRVEVVVGWEVGGGEILEIKNESIFSNWSRSIWNQDDWSGGGGQSLWGDDDRYFSDDGNIDIASGTILLKETGTTSLAVLGSIESSAFQIEENRNYNVVEWSATSTKTGPCPECEARVWIKTAPDSSGVPGVWTSTWSGPDGDDGDEVDYFATSTGSLISTDHDGDRWLKYKIELIGNGTHTPSFEEMKISYN